MQEQMQEQMQEVQASLSTIIVEASSGGGALKVVARGDGTIASVKIDPQVLAAGDASILADPHEHEAVD